MRLDFFEGESGDESGDAIGAPIGDPRCCVCECWDEGRGDELLPAGNLPELCSTACATRAAQKIKRFALLGATLEGTALVAHEKKKMEMVIILMRFSKKKYRYPEPQGDCSGCKNPWEGRIGSTLYCLKCGTWAKAPE